VRLLKRHRLRFVEAVLVAAMTIGAVLSAPWRGGADAPPPATATSLAVLPFTVESSDRDVAYLAEGLAAGLVDSVATRTDARVLLHRPPGEATQAAINAANGRDLRAIARALNVGALLLGALAQSGGRVTVELRLVDGATGARLWARRYDGRLARLVTLRDGMTRDLLGRLSVADDPATRQPSRETPDPEAYELYLKGRYVWNKRTEDGFRRAVEYFRQAIERDPQYARAYAGLADGYNLLGIWGALPPQEAMPLVEDAARHAIALDGTLAEAHASLAFVQWVYHREWDAAAAGFQRALVLDPAYATGHAWYAYYLASRRQFDEAIVSVNRAHSLEPLSLSIGTDVGEIYYWAGRYDEARRALESVLDVEPDFAMARNILGLVLLRTGRVDEAVAQLEAAFRLGEGPRTLSTLAYAYGAAGMHAQADAAMNELMRMAGERYTSSFALGIAHLGAGQTEAALDRLEDAFDERSDSMVILAAYPLLDPLRGHPRFTALLTRVGVSPADPD
jgi:TolB-like protein/Flp pilus assembly protein TadD